MADIIAFPFNSYVPAIYFLIVAAFILPGMLFPRMRRSLACILIAGIVLFPALSKLISAQENTLSTPVALISAGMNAEDTANLDEAARLYRQAINTPAMPRVFAAFAQFSISQISLRKGDMATATLELDKLAKDYEDCSDLVRTLVSESHKDIFNGIHPQYSSNDISYVQNGRYHHISTGFEVSLQNWYFGTNFHSSGGGDTVYLRQLNSDTQIANWLKPDHLSADEIPNRLRGAILQKLLQRLTFENYRVRPESARMLTIGGKQALSAVSDYGPGPQGIHMAEYLTWIYTEKTRVLFFARVPEPRFQNLKPVFDQIIATASVP